MIADGASIIDVGGESTRPGAQPVDAVEEIRRVVPVITALRHESRCVLSIDTLKPAVMRAACEAGAELINDVNALRSPGALDVARDSGAAVCLMHMLGEPRTMQVEPRYDDVVIEVRAFLERRIHACVNAGIAPARARPRDQNGTHDPVGWYHWPAVLRVAGGISAVLLTSIPKA